MRCGTYENVSKIKKEQINIKSVLIQLIMGCIFCVHILKNAQRKNEFRCENGA